MHNGWIAGSVECYSWLCACPNAQMPKILVGLQEHKVRHYTHATMQVMLRTGLNRLELAHIITCKHLSKRRQVSEVVLSRRYQIVRIEVLGALLWRLARISLHVNTFLLSNQL